MTAEEIDRLGTTIQIEEVPYIEIQHQRLAALLLTLEGWDRNFTASVDAAKWLIAEAEAVGWTLAINSRRI